MRLPSEAEWEYACRAGSRTAFCFGQTITPDQVNCDGRNPYGDAAKGLYREKTVSVGSLPGNAFGLHEVHGNLFEWCEDAYVYNYKEGPNTHPPRNTKNPSYRVLRGGCWLYSAVHCRSAGRYRSTPVNRSLSVGFRLSRGIDP